MTETPTGTIEIRSERILEMEQKVVSLVRKFVGRNAEYYVRVFIRLETLGPFVWTFNMSAALLGPVWAAGRGLWVCFWIYAFAELYALAQLTRGLWANLGAEDMARAERLSVLATERLTQATDAAKVGAENADQLMNTAQELARAVRESQEAAEIAVNSGPWLATAGALLLLAVKLVEGACSNWAYERRFTHWRSNKRISTDLKPGTALVAALFVGFVYAATLYRFTAADPPALLLAFPASKEMYIESSRAISAAFAFLLIYGESTFDVIAGAIRGVLDAFEFLLVETPWPVVILAIVGIAWRTGGTKLAIFTAFALAYLAIFGYWEQSMTTVALLGSAVFTSIVIGIPLGVWCGRKPRIYAAIRPVLDLMQTLPAFVYLIPVIGLFGTGKVPGIIATLMFGIPPVVRMTALGIMQVPLSVREAATAFGATTWQLLLKVEIPLAMPSIKAGINLTVLTCLSMVVIAALIGAKGLGQSVLQALQFAEVGQGILSGIAILLCAMIIDRILQETRDRGNPNKR